MSTKVGSSVRKVVVIGVGSIGSRHVSNLRTLRPEADLVVCDPRFLVERFGVVFTDYREAIRGHPDADCVIIASPTEAHLGQIHALSTVPFYCEKPLCSVEQFNDEDVEIFLDEVAAHSQVPCAVGFQYRFALTDEMRAVVRRNGHVRFYARDRLIDRYGPTCLETMASAGIGLGLWLLGPAREVNMQTDGASVRGRIVHTTGAVSGYDYRIDDGTRVSMLVSESADGKTIDGWGLSADNQMYLDALLAWLGWVEGGERDERTAVLSDGLAVMAVMSKVAAHGFGHGTREAVT